MGSDWDTLFRWSGLHSQEMRIQSIGTATIHSIQLLVRYKFDFNMPKKRSGPEKKWSVNTMSLKWLNTYSGWCQAKIFQCSRKVSSRESFSIIKRAMRQYDDAAKRRPASENAVQTRLFPRPHPMSV